MMKCPKCGTEDPPYFKEGDADCRWCQEPFQISKESLIKPDEEIRIVKKDPE